MQGRKPTTDEIAERIELCRSMLLRRVPKSTIKKAFRQRFGAELSANTIEGYLGPAGVDATGRDLRVLRPGRDQAPFARHQLTAAGVGGGSDRGDLLGGANVER